jgi:serine/threonine protein kinase
MNHLTKLAKALSFYHFHREAAEVLNLKPVEHPDWKDEWEEPREISPEEVVPNGLGSSYEGSVQAKINGILRGLGITIMSDANGNPLGSGGHGAVYRCIYKGKSGVSKIQFYPADETREYGEDVKRWEKMLSIWDAAPDFVKKHLPNVLLATEGTFDVNTYGFNLYKRDYRYGSFNFDKSTEGSFPFKYQIMVMEELKPIPRKLEFSIEGSQWQGNPESTWLWEEELENFYPEIWNEFQKKNIAPPTKLEILKIIKTKLGAGETVANNLNKFLRSKIKEYFSDFDNEGMKFYFTLHDIVQGVSRKFLSSIPRWKDEEDKDKKKDDKKTEQKLNPETNYIPKDVESLWEAIKWLRENGMAADDIIKENIMIDSSGTLKIADLGGL